MRVKEVFYSTHFSRAMKKLRPEDKTTVTEREKIFRENCFDPRLKTHKLKGKWKNFWSFSITESHRILFEFLDDNTVGFVDVGDHDLYR